MKDTICIKRNLNNPHFLILASPPVTWQSRGCPPPCWGSGRWGSRTPRPRPTRSPPGTCPARSARGRPSPRSWWSRSWAGNSEHLTLPTCLLTIYCSHFTCVLLNMNVKERRKKCKICLGKKSFGVLELRVLQYLRKNSIITAYCMLFATHSCFTIMLADTRPCFEYENPRPLLIKAVKINRTQIFINRGPRSVGLALAGLS